MQTFFTFIIEIVNECDVYECDDLILIRKSTMLPSSMKLYFSMFMLSQKSQYILDSHIRRCCISNFFAINKTYVTIFLFNLSFHNKVIKLTLTSSLKINVTTWIKSWKNSHFPLLDILLPGILGVPLFCFSRFGH